MVKVVAICDDGLETEDMSDGTFSLIETDNETETTSLPPESSDLIPILVGNASVIFIIIVIVVFFKRKR